MVKTALFRKQLLSIAVIAQLVESVTLTASGILKFYIFFLVDFKVGFLNFLEYKRIPYTKLVPYITSVYGVLVLLPVS